jgi:hypothetical protein
MDMSMCPRCSRPAETLPAPYSHVYSCLSCRRVRTTGDRSDHSLTWSTTAQWQYLHDTREVVPAPVPAPLRELSPREQMVKRLVAVLKPMKHVDRHTVLDPLGYDNPGEFRSYAWLEFVEYLEAQTLDKLADVLGVA